MSKMLWMLRLHCQLSMLAAWLYAWQCWSVGRSMTLVQTEISVGWIAILRFADIHGAQRMNRNDFSDPLTFSLAPP